MARSVSYGQPIPFPELTAIAREAGVYGRLLPEVWVENRLKLHVDKMLSALYERLASYCRGIGAKCYFVLAANTVHLTDDERKTVERTATLARHVGLTVLDLTRAYGGVDRLESLWITPWDNHPNAVGHRLLADHMYEQLAPLLLRAVVQKISENPSGFENRTVFASTPSG